MLVASDRLEDFKKWMQEGQSLIVEELWDAPKALLLSIAKQATHKHIVVLTGGIRESRLFEDLVFFEGESPFEFHSWETLPSEEISPSPDIVGERYQILKQLQESKKPHIILTTLQACLQRVLPPERLGALHLVLKVGKEVPFKELADVLSEMGYHRKPVAADKGEFAVRGGIIDIFPVSSPDPFRIEFAEDTIESIRSYDPIGQVSIGKVDQIVITPGEERELLLEQKSLSTLFDYLGDQTLIVFDDLLALEDKYVALKEMSVPSSTFCSFEEFCTLIAPMPKLYFTSSPLEELSEVKFLGRKEQNPYAEGGLSQALGFHAFSQEWVARRWRHPFHPLFPTFCPPEKNIDDFSADEFLKAITEHALKIHCICATESEEHSLKQKLKPPMQAELIFERGYLSSGFLLKEPAMALLPMTELTHRYRIRRQKQRSPSQSVAPELFALNTGEAVVHMNSGIGRFLGIEKRPNHLGVETEFMLVEYAGGSKLYVPMEQAHLISKYIGATDELPRLSTLGDNHWKRAKERTEKAILGYAKDLLQMQAERALKGGFAYPPNSDLIAQFAEEFPYHETPDQLEAIKKIHEDMISGKSMDRLICGDVGYGKTEVAMRAAFKAAVDGGKQVAVLVPTTVLAMQHFDTFTERMSNFPVRIGIVSRFRTPKQVRETLAEVEKGTIDILIGTHRMVSKDVKFKDLGLLIIDEEQRFGVKAKEHLKQFKKEVDCLTLSATPIPRTLYMSLVGARDMSVINTPPEDRLPIQTIVCQSSDEVLKNALLRELSRDGQAYVIHNRVESIFQMAERIRTLLPAARIVVGHGQMSADELDLVFHTFKSGNADILVATSIIENGIDIPNANTILVDRADRFGLADLYQIRGRVGRWNRKAYCYFLVSSTRELSEISRKRLSALSQSSGHGGGMKVAMHDLELRGAGNILGTEQSGHVAAIGFHLYCKLLRKTIASLQKKDTPIPQTDVKMEFPFDARVPEDYIDEIGLRLEVYQRLGEAESEVEVDTLIAQIRDRFGPLPIQVEWLYHLTRLRTFAARNQFIYLKLTKIVLLAEQQHGKQEKLSKKILIQAPSSPSEVERYITSLLQKNFPQPINIEK